MKNMSKLVVIIVLVAIGAIIGIKNINDMNTGYIVSDIEKQNEAYTNNTYSKEEDKQTNIQVGKLENSISDSITIYISGEVKTPGVVELNVDDRLADGVKLCGGLTEQANLNGINLAMKIKDEGHYIIPKIGDEIDNSTINNSNESNNSENIEEGIIQNENKDINKNKININTATISELDTLPGFGEITAQKIIDYRQEHTKFNSIEEIKNIKGIGEKKFNDVKDYICVQ